MQTTTIESFQVIGIRVRTTNEYGQAGQDIPALWSRFSSENIFSRIPGRESDDIYSVYTNYEKDHTKPYDVIIGCKVKSLENVPEGMVGQTIEGGNYSRFISKGDFTKGAVYDTWVEIWNSGLNRKFSADWEVYGKKAQDPTVAEVDIFIALS